jgi:hypothetical protein
MLVVGNESQTSQTRPGATNGGLLLEMLLAELGLATRQEETPDEGSPGVQDKVTPGDVVVSQVVKTVRVHSGFKDADRRFLPNLMGQGITAAVDSVGKPKAQTGRLSWSRPGNDTDPGYCMEIRNLPPQYRYQAVPDSHDIGALPDNFWLLLAKPTWWELHNKQHVNIGSIEHALGADRRVDKKTKMSNYKSSRFYDKQEEFVAEIHEALDRQDAPVQEPIFKYMSFSRSELKCRHTPCERHPPKPDWMRNRMWSPQSCHQDLTSWR